MDSWGLDYWKSKDWETVQEKLEKEDGYNPSRSDLFRSLTVVDSSLVRVAIVGQDPYPNKDFATGMAFSIPSGRRDYPSTLREIFGEYNRDLGYPIPSNGDLSGWAKQGVLLWNVIPSCRTGLPLSHDWIEYQSLSTEIFRRLSARGIVFAFLGAVARRYEAIPDRTNNRVIVTSHPSPRGSLNSRTPFRGSRLFSTINAKLNEIGLNPIDWRLDVSPSQSDLQRPDMVGCRILPNISGEDLGGLRRKTERNLYRPEWKMIHATPQTEYQDLSR